MKQTIILAALGLSLFPTPFGQAQTRLERSRPEQKSQPGAQDRSPKATRSAPALQGRIKQCMRDTTCLRIVAEYGAMFVANTSQVTLPAQVYFRGEAEVQRFQKQVQRSDEVINGVHVELQPAAFRAFERARKEARRYGLEITPRGTDAARRSYADTVRLWSGRVEAGLRHWVRRGALSKSNADGIRSLPLRRQVSAVLELEENHLFFGNGFGKSILQSVAAPGASQHNAMLALDIEQFGHPLIRRIMANHGWFQTVENDAPHFTYLGMQEAALPSLGLRRIKNGDRTVCLPRIEIQRPAVPDGGRRTASPAESDDAGTSGQESTGTGNARDRQASRQEAPLATIGTGGQLAATISSGVKILKEMVPLLRKLAQLYFERSGKFLHITSGYRTAGDQAKAMYHNLIAYGKSHVLSTYGWRNAVREIVSAYQGSGKSPASAIKAMTKVIHEQIQKGVYISDHLLHNAFDIRLSSAKQSVLRSVVRSMGGRILVEPDHYHVEF